MRKLMHNIILKPIKLLVNPSYFLLLHSVICLKLRSDSYIGRGHPSQKTVRVGSSFYGSLARQSPLKPTNEYKKTFWWKITRDKKQVSPTSSHNIEVTISKTNFKLQMENTIQ